jgi:glucose/arabinose dehydrogenase
MKIYSLIAFLVALGVACNEPPAGRGAGEVQTSSNVSFKVEKVAGGLEVPWSIVWAPDGRMIFTERPGRVRVMEKGTLNPKPLLTLTDVESAGEAGLMSVALHPQFNSNHFVYLSYAYTSGGLRVRVVRYREAAEGLVDRKVIIEDLPAARAHAGCRIRFGSDGKLYVTTGDATNRNLAQQLNSLAGKTLRLNDDGTVRRTILSSAGRTRDLRFGRLVIATRRAWISSRVRISCFRLNMDQADLTAPEEETK